MEINYDIINVLTKDFSFVKTTLENSTIDSISKSLKTLTVALNQYEKSISSMKANSCDDRFNTKFIPYFNSGQMLQEIKELSEDIILLSGIDQNSDDFNDIRQKAWQRYKKIVVGDDHRDMVTTYTKIYIDMFIAANPRNSQLPIALERYSVDPELRYAKFVELVNKNFSMKDIAVAFGLSIPAIYLVRTQFKMQLLLDPDVNKTAKAMKFNCQKRKVATG